MKQLFWICLTAMSTAGCGVITSEPPDDSEQLGVVEQDVLGISIKCRMPGDEAWHFPGCRTHLPNATNAFSLLVWHTDAVNPLRYFWHVPGLEIMSGCKENQGYCNLAAGNACTDRHFLISLDAVDTVTGQLVSASATVHFPAVCFTFGKAVFC